jgi:hypothetical protein
MLLSQSLLLHVSWSPQYGSPPSRFPSQSFCKKVIRIMSNIRSRDSCRDMFKEWKMLPFYSQYVYSLLTFVLNNSELFITNSMISNINTRQKKTNLHLPLSRLKFTTGGVHYMGSKVFDRLPLYTKSLFLTKKYKCRSTVKDYQLTNSYY